MFIWIYMHFSFLLIKEGWKRRAEFFLIEIIKLRPKISLCSKAMAHSCQIFNSLCLLIIIMTLTYFASAKFSQRTKAWEVFLVHSPCWEGRTRTKFPSLSCNKYLLQTSKSFFKSLMMWVIFFKQNSSFTTSVKTERKKRQIEEYQLCQKRNKIGLSCESQERPQLFWTPKKLSTQKFFFLQYYATNMLFEYSFLIQLSTLVG